jgi:hypothetical protein
MSFARASAPTGSVTFSGNPRIYSKKEKYYQPKEVSEGGTLYAYDKGINPEKILTFSWSVMTLTDFDNLMIFYEAVKETRYSFTFTDHLGATATARFIDGISGKYLTASCLAVSFDIRLE